MSVREKKKVGRGDAPREEADSVAAAVAEETAEAPEEAAAEAADETIEREGKSTRRKEKTRK
jgi:hypothetical protein